MAKEQVQQKMNVSSKAAQSSMQTSSAGGKMIPTLVKVIAVLYYIGAVVLLLFAILFFAGAGFIGTLLPAEMLGALGTGLFIVLGVVFLALAVLDFFIGRGLWKGKNWARILVIIFSVLGVLGSIMGIVGGEYVSNIFGLIISGLIGYYMLFTKQVQDAFA